MFDIISIKLNDFRSYYGEHFFEFPTKPGLYSLTGSNLTNQRLEANDVGKTTLLESIHWCLFGRTSRGLRAGDVISWDRTSCSVDVLFAVSDKQLLIRRQQSPNALTINGHSATQNEVEAELRLTADQFSYAIMLPQFGSAFFDLSPSEKLSLFSQIMGLDFWLEKANEANALAGDLAKEISKIEKSKVFYSGRLEATKAGIEEARTHYDNFAQEKKQKATTINRQIKDIEKHIEKQRLRLSQDQNELRQIEKRIASSNTLCTACKQPLNTERLRTLKQNQRDFQVDLNQCERTLSAYEVEKERYEQRLIEEKERANPYEELIKTRALEVSSLERKIADLAAQTTTLSSDHAAVDFWVSGFKRVRLYVVETTLKQLEIEINNNLTSLGLADWRVQLDIERENKSGGVTKGFTVLIYAPNRTTPVRWEAFGGGATQRLRLAGNLGLANLIMERAGLTSKIEFFDEFSQHMSDAGVEDTLELLHARALELGRKIWVVEHRSLEFGNFAGVLTVKKDEKGSHFELG